MRRCLNCKQDDGVIRDAAQAGQLHKPHFTCPVHKDYRVYQDELLKFSDWAIVGTTILSVPIVWPLTAVANTLDLDLVAIFKLFIIPVNSGWVPLTLAVTWASASSTGIIAGAVCGLLGGLLSWMITCSVTEGFSLAAATGNDPLAAGNAAATLISLVVTVVVSKLKPDEVTGWRLTQSIINPLTPWIATFEKELKVKEAPMWHWIPDTDEIIDTFKNWAWFAVVTTVGCFLVIYLGLPLVMTTDRLSLSGVNSWIMFVNGSTLVTALVMIIVPFVQEVKSIVVELGRDKSKVDDISRHPSIFKHHDELGAKPKELGGTAPAWVE